MHFHRNHKQYAYGYDLTGNRTSDQVRAGGPLAVSSTTFNNLNQLTNRVGNNGLALFAGSLDKQDTVLINGANATMNHQTTNLAGYVVWRGATSAQQRDATGANVVRFQLA